MAKRKTVRKKSSTGRKVSRIVRKAGAVARKGVRRRKSTGSGKKMNLKTVLVDAAALVGGFTLAGIAGQTMAARGVNPNVSALIPAAGGLALALKMKNPAVKIAGLAMVAAAGVNMVNSAMKQAAGNTLAGDDLDALDVYRNPALLGVPVSMGNDDSLIDDDGESMMENAMLGVPVDMAGAYDDDHGLN